MHPPYVIRVVSLHMQDCGTFNPMFERPMVTDVKDMHYLYDFNRRIEQNQVKMITPSVTAGLASRIVAPSAIPGSQIQVLNGWDMRRIRFILHVAVDIPGGSGLADDEYYFQGFTDHGDVGYGGAIDPRMLLVINSFVRIGKENVYGEHNHIYTRRFVKDSGQIINGNIMYQCSGQQSYGLRPKDAFIGLQSMDVANAQTDDTMLFDNRYRFGNKSGINNKYHTSPAAYLASVTHSYFNALHSSSWDKNGMDLYERAKNAAGQDVEFDNPFFRRMRSIVNEPNYVGTSFTMSALEMLDPNLSSVTTLAKMGQATQAQYHHQGQTEYWSGALVESQWATILGQAVPALLMEMMISNMTFMVTNRLIGGQPAVTLIDAMSITGADITQQLETFKQRLICEVMNDISYNNMMPYDITIRADSFGETHIKISLDNNPFIDYCVPTFIDSMVSPMMTSNKNVFYNNVNDLGYILTEVGQYIEPDYGTVNRQFLHNQSTI